MHIMRGLALGIDIVIDPLRLLLTAIQVFGQLRSRNLAIVRPQGNIHLLIRQGEIKLILALLQAVGIGGRDRRANLLRQPQMTRQGIDLGLE